MSFVAFTTLAGELIEINAANIDISTLREVPASIKRPPGVTDATYIEYDTGAKLAVRGTVSATALLIEAGGGGGTGTGGVLAIPTIAALSLIRPSIDGTLAIVAGYYTANDGGGGTFIWSATTSKSLANGGTIIITAGSGAWLRQEALSSQTWNAKWFGATGDGVTDDTNALNALFVALGKLQTVTPDGTFLGGGVAYVPRGVYVCSDDVDVTPLVYTNISFHISMRGDGRLVSILKFSNGGLLATDYPGGNVSSQVHLCDFGLYNVNVANLTSGIYYQGAADCCAERLYLSGWAEAITWLDCNEMVAREIVFAANPLGIPASSGSIGIAMRDSTNQALVDTCQFNGPAVNVLHAGGALQIVRGCNSEGGILGRFQGTTACVHEQWTQESQNITNTPSLFHFDDQGSGVNVVVALGITIRDCFLGGSTIRDLVLFDAKAIAYDIIWAQNQVANCPPAGVITLPSATHIGGSCVSYGAQVDPTSAPLWSNKPPQWVDLNSAPSSGYYVSGGAPLLPATALPGTTVYAVNGRKVGEGPGAGTGVPVYFSTGAWRVASTDLPVTA